MARTTPDGSRPAQLQETIDEIPSEETDALQKSDPPTPRNNIFHAFGSWKLEVAALVLAIGSLVAVFVTLASYSGQDVPKWPWGINLNSLVAIYTTVLRACLLLSLAEVISQEKWLWFRRPRPLQHLEAFDLASRGVWGSLKLILVAYSSAVPFLAAITAVALLAIDPFTQQSIKTVLCNRVIDTPNSAARIPVAVKLPQDEVTIDGWNGLPDAISAESMNSVLGGLTTPEFMAPANTLDFSCPTGNCTFPEFDGGITHSSLGICSQCDDLTSLVRQEPNCPHKSFGIYGGSVSFDEYFDCKFSFAPPNSDSNLTFQIATVPFLINSTGADTRPYDIFNISILSRSRAGCVGPDGMSECPSHAQLPGLRNNRFNFTIIGATCSLFPCVRYYHTEIVNGQLLEQTIKSEKLNGEIYTPVGAEITLAGIANPCIVDSNTMYDASNMTLAASRFGVREFNITTAPSNTTTTVKAPLPCSYEIETDWMQMLGKMVNSTFTGKCHSIGAQRAQFAYLPMYCDDQWWLNRLYNNDTATFEAIKKSFEDVADSVTNRIRSIGLRWDATDNRTSPPAEENRAFVAGTVNTTTVCIEFDFKWLLLPAALTILACGLLVASILRTHENQAVAWKSSTLPLLFHGFRRDQRVDAMVPDHRMSLDEMERVSNEMIVRLAADEHGGCGMVVGEQQAAGKVDHVDEDSGS
ncbi:hypothetical protein B0H66DRAFT_491 [Apodospora peruviana]|uniref:Uncharacterized protein n=1 Tax=Apodospora peruviana TaxID=516989 RepID=A0AAE0IP10_9PEZI|nr:hypothetical protein B0H66DRAFT_491 [Apodospora peruviana]